MTGATAAFLVAAPAAAAVALTAQVLLLLLLALALAWFGRRGSSRTLHLLWTATFALVLGLLPADLAVAGCARSRGNVSVNLGRRDPLQVVGVGEEGEGPVEPAGYPLRGREDAVSQDSLR